MPCRDQGVMDLLPDCGVGTASGKPAGHVQERRETAAQEEEPNFLERCDLPPAQNTATPSLGPGVSTLGNPGTAVGAGGVLGSGTGPHPEVSSAPGHSCGVRERRHVDLHRRPRGRDPKSRAGDEGRAASQGRTGVARWGPVTG